MKRTDAILAASKAERELHEAIRQSHCDHVHRDDPSHQCRGTTTISPTGTRLSCPLCGSCPLQGKHIDGYVIEEHLIKLVSATQRKLDKVMDAQDNLACALIAPAAWPRE